MGTWTVYKQFSQVTEGEQMLAVVQGVRPSGISSARLNVKVSTKKDMATFMRGQIQVLGPDAKTCVKNSL
jgi:hypothetical protein